MVMKSKIAKLEDVSEGFREHYKADPAGGFVLDAEGLVPKERVDEFRTNNIQLQQALDKLKDVDPVKYAELIQLDVQVKEGKLIKEGKLEEVVNLRVGAMKKDYETKEVGLTTRATKAESQLAKLMIDDGIKSVALKAGIQPTAVEDVVLRARGVYHVVDGAPVPKAADGNVIYAKDGKTPMPMDDWITGLKESAPHLFLGSQGSGAGGGGRSGNLDLSKASPVDKIAAGLAAGGLLSKLPGES